MTEKDGSIIELNKKLDEDRILHEKNMEIMQLKMNEQKESYEHKIVLLEEDHHKRTVNMKFAFLIHLE